MRYRPAYACPPGGHPLRLRRGGPGPVLGLDDSRHRQRGGPEQHPVRLGPRRDESGWRPGPDHDRARSRERHGAECRSRWPRGRRSSTGTSSTASGAHRVPAPRRSRATLRSSSGPARTTPRRRARTGWRSRSSRTTGCSSRSDGPQPLGQPVGGRELRLPDERRRRLSGRRRGSGDGDGLRRGGQRSRLADLSPSTRRASSSSGWAASRAPCRSPRRGAGHAGPGGRLLRRRRQRHGRQLALLVRGACPGISGRRRERRRARERAQRHVLPDGRAVLQPDRRGRRGEGVVPRIRNFEHGPGHAHVHGRGRTHPRRRRRARHASRPPGWLGRRRAVRDGRPVGILCRTSNIDPFGVVPGTFGAQQRPTPLLSFLMSADAGAVITGIRQGGAFRTNVGFAAGADGAGWDLALKSASGAHGRDGDGVAGRVRLDAAERPGPLSERDDPRRRDAPGEGDLRQRGRLRLVDRQRVGRPGRHADHAAPRRRSRVGDRRTAGRLGEIRGRPSHPEGACGSARLRRDGVRSAEATGDPTPSAGLHLDAVLARLREAALLVFREASGARPDGPRERQLAVRTAPARTSRRGGASIRRRYALGAHLVHNPSAASVAEAVARGALADSPTLFLPLTSSLRRAQPQS